MKRENTLALNTHFLNERIDALKLKQIVISSACAVSPKTVNRWQTGQTKRISKKNAELLSSCLKCPLEKIILKNDPGTLATKQDQKTAADLIYEKELLKHLGPSDNWELAEGLIKATMEPNLPDEKLGHLYNLLSEAAWRQERLDEAILYAHKAVEISEKAKIEAIRHKGHLNLAIIYAFQGNNLKALELFNWCLEHLSFFEKQESYADTLSRAACTHHEFGNFNKSISLQKKSILLFKSTDCFFDLSFACLALTGTLYEFGHFESAKEAGEEAFIYAEKSGSKRNALIAKLYLADISNLSQFSSDRTEEFEHLFEKLSNVQSPNPYWNEIISRHYRIHQKFKKAEEHIVKGFQQASEMPLIQALNLQEHARLAFACKQFNEEKSYRLKANDIFKSIHLKNRILLSEIKEYGQMFL